MKRGRLASLALTALATSVLAWTVPSRACAPAWRAGADTVRIAGEEAIIVWDAATHTEHFIRHARFTTRAEDFGFLVPTPTVPTLAEGTGADFDLLGTWIAPRVVARRHTAPTFGCALLDVFGRSKHGAVPTAAEATVRVLGEQRVAGYDATILGADDPKALATWLADHGYHARPSLKDWLAGYVASKWDLTAFKIAGDPTSETIGSGVVRMTFRTDTPFFPYREPGDPHVGVEGPRLLRVFFIDASGRAEGAIGLARLAWPGKLVYANKHALAGLNLGLPPGSLPEEAWLTVFEDPSSPRPGNGELYFARSAVEDVVTPPPIYVDMDESFTVPLDLLGFGAAMLVVGGIWVRRRGRSEPS